MSAAGHALTPSSGSQKWPLRPTIAAAAGTVVFTTLALLQCAGATDAADRAIMQAVPELHSAAFKFVAVAVSRGMSVLGLAIATVLVSAWLYRRRRADAIMLALGMAVAAGAMLSLKLAFARARPDVFEWLDAASSWSFPSGHALSNTTFWLLLAVIARRGWMWWVAIAMAITAGAFRVIAGVHWPSDVVAGWALGVALVGAAVLVKARFTRAQASAINAPL